MRVKYISISLLVALPLLAISYQRGLADSNSELSVTNTSAIQVSEQTISPVSKEILGRLEYVLVADFESKLKARIDSGAGLSSLDAKIIEISRSKDGAERITFDILDRSGGKKRLRRKIVDWIEIKGKGTRRSSKRPVVILSLCLGGKILKGRVNLADRSNFLYPVLIGRNLLKKGDFLIDVRQKYLIHHQCPRKKEKKGEKKKEITNSPTNPPTG